jgi:hypothetical protein
MVTRRDFLGLLAVPLLARPSSRLESSPGAFPQGEISMHPILDTLAPVIEGARHVQFHDDKVRAVADWMAYEELPWPDFRSPLTPQGDDPVTMDFTFLTSTINFAFTDFESHTIFKAQYAGGEHWDSLGMEACLKRAYDEGIPILDGSWLAAVSREELDRVFTGNIRIPMLDERVAIFHEVGNVLKDKYDGRFHNFVKSGPSRLYADGEGLLERLLAEFPSFRDTSLYRGARIAFQKRAQLLWWQLHARFQREGFFAIEDPEKLTVFADYIVPVAFRLFGMVSYTPELERVINERRVIPADSEEEIEIRAFTIWGGHRLTEEINKRRPADLQVIDPVVDGRLWTHFHASHWPHHLTITTDY